MRNRADGRAPGDRQSHRDPVRRISAGAPWALLGLAALTALAATASAAPTVDITSPAPNDTVSGGTVAVTLAIGNFTLNGSAVGQAAMTGEGHYHLFLDGVYQRFDFRTGTLLANVSDGDHVITVELAQNDHTLIGVNDSVGVTIVGGTPKVKLLSPSWDGAIGLNWTFLTVNITNFRLEPNKLGQAPVSGEGHWHYFVDGVFVGMAGETNASLLDLTPGDHIIRVDLRQNNHAALTPPVYDEAFVHVEGRQPAISITAPVPEAVVWGSTVVVAVTVTNFTLDPAAVGGLPVNGKGHYLVSIGGTVVGYSAGATFTVTALPAGDLTITVTLVSSDNSSMAFPVSASVLVHAAPLPGITITAPANGTTTTSTSLALTATVTNFTLAPDKIGQAPIAGVGHFHIFVDGAYLSAGAGSSFEVRNLTLGTHDITVTPFNNDHSTIVGARSSSITVFVTSPPPPSGFLPAFGALEALAAAALVAAVGAALSRRRA